MQTLKHPQHTMNHPSIRAWLCSVGTSIAAVLALLFAPLAHADCHIVVHGDSLSAAYGLKREEGWVSLLQLRLKDTKPACRVTNTSISGETTSGGLSRLPALMDKYQPSHLILELGANDGLRGLDTAAMQSNLMQMIKLGRDKSARVVLVGVRIPPNYGKAYQDRFDAVFLTLAKEYKLPRVPSLLDGFEADRNAFQADGLHPTAASQARMLDNVWPQLQPLL